METTTFWTLGNVLSLLIGTGILAALIHIGRKLQVLDGLVRTTEKIERNLKVVTDHLINSRLPFGQGDADRAHTDAKR